MPKPMHRQDRPSWTSQYEDPDRDTFCPRRGDGRRVSFKPRNSGGGGGDKYNNHHRKKDWGDAIRQHLEDEAMDVGAMGGGAFRANNKRFGKGGGRKGGRRAGSPPPQRKLFEAPIGWYQVIISYGDKYNKDFLQKLMIENLQPEPFSPVQWTKQGPNISFYVEGYAVASKIFNMDRQLQMSDGFHLMVRVRPGIPNVEISAALKEKMKLAMGKRYDAEKCSLNMASFHSDPDIREHFCVLFKPVVITAVLDIIAENIPQLRALNLDNNKLNILSLLKRLPKVAPNISVIHLKDNRINDLTQLDNFSSLPIVDLVLEGNPACNKLKDKGTYQSDLRKKFPKLLRLDGVDLPPPINFDIQDEVKLPDGQKTFLCNNDGGVIVRQFLEQYFLIYDSDNRANLAQAYHDDAMFSLTAGYPYGQHQNDKNRAWLNWYNTNNRNVLRVDNSDRRMKMLKKGKQEVIDFLEEMPKTKHDLHSFTADLNIYTPQMLSLTITGMFKELNNGHKVPPLRHFCRTMVIVPANGGFSIANDMFHITNATPEQAKNAFKVPVTPPVAAQPPPPVQVSTEIQERMVLKLSMDTSMNAEWSKKCLEETHWDFEGALTAFKNLHMANGVPPEAFVK